MGGVSVEGEADNENSMKVPAYSDRLWWDADDAAADPCFESAREAWDPRPSEAEDRLSSAAYSEEGKTAQNPRVLQSLSD